MKNKPIVIVLTVLFLMSTTCSVLGFLNHKKKNEKPVTPVIVENVTYESYIEDVAVTQMPTNDEENNYIYASYECENNMTIDFNEEDWSFKTNNKKDGVCKLYFNKAAYSIVLTTTNGLINEEDTSYTEKVERFKDGQFKIVPNEGYEFKEVSCSNDKEATYDKSTNTLSINSVTEDIACKIDFVIKSLTAEIRVSNGEGATTLTANYGESVSAVVKADDGYEKPKVTCTNNQTGTFEDNKFTIAKLTDNTRCDISFEKAPIITYKLMIDELSEHVTITAGSKEQSIISGKDGKFSLRAEEGYKITLDCNGVKPSDEKSDPDGTVTYTFLGITKDITCNVGAELTE